MPGAKPDACRPGWPAPRPGPHPAVAAHQGHYDDYLALRSQGYSPEQARDLVRPDVDTSPHPVTHQMRPGARGLRQRLRPAILEGKDPDEARQAASDASSAQHHGDSVDHQNRQDSSTPRTYKGLYDQGSALVDNTQSIVDHANSSTRPPDLGEYDDYEDQDDDRSAQTWAKR